MKADYIDAVADAWEGREILRMMQILAECYFGFLKAHGVCANEIHIVSGSPAKGEPFVKCISAEELRRGGRFASKH